MSERERYGVGRARTFPPEWGAPPGQPFSEDRAAWVRKMVEQHSALTAHRRLAGRDAALLVVLRRTLLERRRDVRL